MSNKWLKVGILGLVIALLGIAAVASYAQDNRPGGQGWDCHYDSQIIAAAKVLDMDESALIAELKSGKSIADVAKAKGVAVDKIVDEFVAPYVQYLSDLVTAKRLTQAQADKLLTATKTSVAAWLDVPVDTYGFGMGMGFGMGRGGRHGVGGGMHGGMGMGENCPFGEPALKSS